MFGDDLSLSNGEGGKGTDVAADFFKKYFLCFMILTHCGNNGHLDIFSILILFLKLDVTNLKVNVAKGKLLVGDYA